MPKITQYTQLTSMAADDQLVVVDTSSGQTKRVTLTDLVNTVAGLIKPQAINQSVADQTARDAIASPYEGLMVYRRDTDMWETYDGTAWRKIIGRETFGVRVKRSTALSIANNSEVVVAWDSEDYDYGTFHDNVTNNSRITVPEAGIYQITAWLDWANAGSGTTLFRILKNGAIVQTVNMPVATAGGDGALGGIRIESLAANDYIEIRAYQNSGSARNILTTSFFAVSKLR